MAWVHMREGTAIEAEESADGIVGDDQESWLLTEEWHPLTAPRHERARQALAASAKNAQPSIIDQDAASLMADRTHW